LPRLRASALVLLALVVAGCGSAKTVTVTQTRTVTSPAPGLPVAVALTHARLLAAARSGDYERLRPLIPAKGFAYTYGVDRQGDPIEFWKHLGQGSAQKPIAILASILEMPYTLNRGLYVWPFAYDKQKKDLTAYERKLLGPLMGYAGQDYYGWRAGIRPDGKLIFFIAGD
jgi:hypothetical protein